MNAKEYLKQYRRLDSHIRSKKEQIDKILLTVDSLAQSKSVGDSKEIEEASTKVAEFGKVLASEIKKLVVLQNEISSKIEIIQNDNYRLVLSLRYLNFKTWEQIAEEMEYSYQWVHRLHERALQEFEKLIEGGE